MKSPSLRMMALALILVSFNLRPGINSVAPVLQAIRDELGMNAFTASLLTSIPVLCMGIIPPFAVKLGQRKGIERVIGWSLAFIVAGNALRLLTGSSIFLLLTAAVAGIGIAAIGPLLSGFIKQHFASNVPALISLYTVALAVGATIASGLSVPLQNRIHSWQHSLAVWALPALIALPVWWLYVLRRVKQPDGKTSTAHAAGLPWHSGRAWLLTLSFGMLGMLFYSLTAWLPPVIEHMGYSKAYAANMLTLFSFIQIPVGLAFPLLLKRIPSRLFWLLLGSFSMLIGFTLIMMSMTPWLAAILIGIGPGVLFPVNLLLPIETAADARQAAAWSAMTQSIGYVIGAAGPLLLGAIHDASGGYASLIVVLLAVNVLMIFIQLRIVKVRTAGGVVALEK
ncbi:CynX/NimT family MFS transporter [Paenibacillus allorhizosphaerae]|uniref:Transporter YycB n=1 Tax=Paenibacillus allorhizosphaerae TaxID=2849866 RepID=A0ABM8VR87_9BACL|nr:MFS transporter [Paenibacillus allorhizosphaerae]CAG7654962.1 putative transporter YycB [Paenibacillus allorhizosphaerae]